jgi:hypothetical protein
MPDDTPDRTGLPTDTPHATEVRDAQATADEAGTRRRAAPAAGGDAAADLELLRGLVAAYGADGVRRMLDSLT